MMMMMMMEDDGGALTGKDWRGGRKHACRLLLQMIDAAKATLLGGHAS